MSTLRTTWIDGEPVAIPEHSRVVHVEGERFAMVAVPHWTVTLLTPTGSLQAPDGATNAGLLAEYFPDLVAESSSVPT